MTASVSKSAAEVERLWSVAANILTDNRKNTSPVLFESLIFLRMNSRLWDVHLVKEAFHMMRSEKARDRIEEDDNYYSEDE